MYLRLFLLVCGVTHSFAIPVVEEDSVIGVLFDAAATTEKVQETLNLEETKAAESEGQQPVKKPTTAAQTVAHALEPSFDTSSKLD